MSDRGLKRYVWKGREKDRGREGERERRESHSSLHPSPRPSSHRPSPRPSPRPARNRRHSTWRLPAFIRKKLDRSGGRVGSTAPRDGQGGVAITGQAFQEPLTYKNPCLPSFGNPVGYPVGSLRRFSSPYHDHEIQDFTTYREPRYLDLFEPGVQVVRDPKLDQPSPTWKERLRPLLSSNLGAVATSKVVIGCLVLLLVLAVGIAAIVTVARLLRFLPEDPRVSFPHVTTATSCGLVKGIVDENAFVFRGIPYALPPKDDFRLRPAKIPNSLEHCWVGNYSANISRPCWTYDSQGAILSGFEDCLLLDVFTPKLGYENPLPVILYVGGVSLGSDSRRKMLLQHAGDLSSARNIVLVSPQIRRGLLGFMPSPLIAASTYPHTAGSQGASDLMASLVWVRHNIEHFGGDKERVTLLGHQAGAALAWPLIRRAHAKDLLHSVWLTGAAPLQPHTIWRNAPYSISRPLNCSDLSCIKKKYVKILMEAAPIDWRRAYGRPWLVADGVFIPMEEEIPRLPMVFGATEQSAAEKLQSWRNRLSSESDIEASILGTLQEILRFNEEPLRQIYHRWREPKKTFETEKAASALRRYSSLADNPWLLLTTLLSDVLTTCPTLLRAAALARQWDHSLPTSRGFEPPVYAYISSHQRASKFGGVADGLSDIESILGVFRAQSSSDSRFANAMQDLFFTFVETGAVERHLATPAHHGVYVVRDTISMERDRRLCNHWVNSSHLARRY